MKPIDLRSDTVTQPTGEMRRAMAEAAVGDDVYGDDPTMNRLETLAAEMAGKEAALFVASGTMGNQLAIMTHTRRGDEVICGRRSHIFEHEVGAAAVLSGVLLNTVECPQDILTPELIEQAIRADDIHCPPTTLLCVENALATGGVVPVETMRANYALAKSRGLKVHMDGARMFNAALALGVDVRELTQNTDSVMFCLSKGLCAPVGSILAGDADFIARARKNRKILGGGMRQAGFLAAAGIVAIEKMTGRLAEDHENARYLGELLSQIPGVRVFFDRLQINMVFFEMDAPEALLRSLKGKMAEKGIILNVEPAGEQRMVTHHGVTREDLAYTAGALQEILAGAV